MCGIVGLLRRGEPRPFQQSAAATVASGTDALAHRGPDGSGHWTDAHCALGHRRLAMVAPEDGAQPIASEDGQIVTVVSGEFYGDRALRERLEARGHRFRTESDSELLVHLYEDHGLDFVDHLNGEYAFLLWDATERVLLAGRDPFGARPLLFTETKNGLAFASEAKALFAMGADAAWDEDMLSVALSLQYPLPGRTLFRGVRELRPGEVIRFTADGETQRASAGPFAPKGPRVDTDFTAAAERVRGTLRAATHARLRGTARVCTLLSGGLDSTAVASLAREVTDLRAYTVRFVGGGPHDESAKSAASARALGLEHRVLEVETAALLDELPGAVAHGEGLAINHHIAAKSLLTRQIRRDGYTAVLSGEGADEVFLGYAHLVADGDAVDSGALAAHNRASAGLMLPAGPGLDLTDVQAALGYKPTWLRAKASLGARIHTLLRPEARDAVKARRPVQMAAQALALGDLRALSNPERSAASWSSFAMASYILKTLGDGMEMRHAVEGRLPFLDPAVAREAAAASVALKLRESDPKALLREALRGVVPEDVRTRVKHPFLAPAPDPAAYGPFLRAQLDHRAFSAAGLFDPNAVGAQVDALDNATHAERTAWNPALMAAMSVAWLGERYGL